MGKKGPKKKARLVRAAKRAKPVPLFVRLKTARKVSSTPARRHWRSGRLQNKDKD
jgi:ribosomal protein L39E